MSDPGVSASFPWDGTEAEKSALLEALARNCTCVVDQYGVRTATCASHQLLLDQKAVDHLLFARRHQERIAASERTTDHVDWAA